MNDDAPLRTTAGALLRAARERQGLHIAALAAAIKVTPRKLDALEHDRYDELPDPAFTRALAQTICRTLKVDPQPVLALLPHADPAALDHVGGSLNTPFRERPSRDDPGGLAAAAIRPMVWAGAALMVAALVVYLLPNGLWPAAPANPPLTAVVPPPAASVPAPAPAPAPALASAPPLAASAPPPAVATASSAPAEPAPAVVAQAPAAAPASAPASAAASLLQLRADQASWVEARDARGQVLVSRVVQAGESVGLNGTVPIKLTIGNARATQVSLRGQPVDLAASTRDNVARLELQ